MISVLLSLYYEHKNDENGDILILYFNPDVWARMVISVFCVIPTSPSHSQQIPAKRTLTWKPALLTFNFALCLTLFMWICCWYCFCFSRNCWCCCWMTSWASVLWGKGADWVRFRGRWRGNLWVPLIPGEILSFVAKGDWGCKGTPPENQNVCEYAYIFVCKQRCTGR